MALSRRQGPAALVAALLAAGCGGAEGTPYADAAPPGGDAAVTVDADFGPALLVEYLDPDHGPFAGGTQALLRGRGFADGMIVTVGGRQVDPLDLEIIDQRRALIRTPPGDPGLADVVVTVGGDSASSAGAFRYEQIYVDPPSGSIAGGTFVRIVGLGTSFQDGDLVTFDGAPLIDARALNEQEIIGTTPPGVGGGADVVIDGPMGTIVAENAYTYLLAADPVAGGFGGGPIAGNLNVAVIDALSDEGVAGAFVTVGDPATTALKGFTDDFGHIVFAQPGLTGPVSVAASKPGYERTVFMGFDRSEATIFLVPIPDPMPGGGAFPPGRLPGRVRGQVVFGDPTGIGVPTWDLVPPPTTPSEVKRTLVYTTIASPFGGSAVPGPGGIIDYENDGRIAWDFDISARPAALAVVAVAGLYDPLADPDGAGPLPPGRFRPFAMGVARGALVGPGAIVENVTVLVDLPLDAALPIDFIDPPPLGEAGVTGPNEYSVAVQLDLGGEGVIRLPDHDRKLAPGQTGLVFTPLPPLQGAVGDASYTVIARATTGGGAPFSIRVLRGVDDLAAPLLVDEWLGVPRAIDPAQGGVASQMRLSYQAGFPASDPTFSYHRLYVSADSTPLWRFYARGGLRELPLWDLVTHGGMTPTPSGVDLSWVIYEARMAGGSGFDSWTYRSVNVNLWSAYAADVYTVQVPPQP